MDKNRGQVVLPDGEKTYQGGRTALRFVLANILSKSFHQAVSKLISNQSFNDIQEVAVAPLCGVPYKQRSL